MAKKWCFNINRQNGVFMDKNGVLLEVSNIVKIGQNIGQNWKLEIVF